MNEVSVILPVYNRPNLLRRALASVKAQTIQPMEVIVVDDASTEDIAGVVANSGLESARVVRMTTRRGPAAARNAGIAASGGTFLAFLDSDDAWTADKIAIQMQHENGPSAVPLSCTGFFFHNGGASPETRTSSQGRIRTPDLAFGCGLSPGSTLIARRSVFDQAGHFDTGLPRFEDWDWLINLGQSNQIGVISEPLAHVYRGAPPESSAVIFSGGKLRSRHVRTFRRYGLRFKYRFLAAIYHELAVAHFHDRRYLSAARSFFLSLLLYPIRDRDFYRRVFLGVKRELFG